MFEAIVNAIMAHNTVIIHRHGRPDGDALGSQIGLQQLLKENYVQEIFIMQTLQKLMIGMFYLE